MTRTIIPSPRANLIHVADRIEREHDRVREECAASTLYYDIFTGDACDRNDQCIALSSRESYTIVDVLSILIPAIKASRP